MVRKVRQMERTYKESLAEMMIPRATWAKKQNTANQLSKRRTKASTDHSKNRQIIQEYLQTEAQNSFIESANLI